MNNAWFTKKHIVIIGFILILLFVVQFVLTHSLLVLSSASGEELQVNLRGGSRSQDFTLKNSSRTFLLSKGSYNIEVTQNDKLSIYHAKLGGLSRQEVVVETKPEQHAVPLGVNSLGCAIDQLGATQVTYYACDEGSGKMVSSTDGIESAAITLRESIEDPESETDGVSLQVYKNGFLEARSLGGTLSIAHYDANGKLLGKPEAGRKDFEGRITDKTFSVAQDTNPVFAVLDDEKQSLLIFKDGVGTGPTVMDLSEKIVTGNLYDARVLASNKYIFVINTKGLQGLDGDIENDVSQEKALKDTRIFVIDPFSQEIVAEHKLAENIYIRELAVSPGGNLLLAPLYATQGTVELSISTSKPRQIPVVNSDIGRLCWKDDEGFYYSADEGSSIYLYSIKESASFLVYSNLLAAVSAIRCDASGRLYFSLLSPDDGLRRHYVLDDAIQTGKRLETVTPLFVGVGDDAVAATPFKNSLVVQPLEGTPNRDQIQQKIFQELRSNGVTENPQLNFLY